MTDAQRGEGVAAAPRGRICMLLRTPLRNDARVIREAHTLVEAGYAVQVVSVGLLGEYAAREWHPAGFEVLRTRPGLWARVKRGRRAGNGAGEAHAVAVGGAHEPSTLRLALMLVSRLLIALRMQALIRRTRPQLLVSHDVNTLFAGWLGARLNGVPLVYDTHEVQIDREGYYRRLRWLIRRLESWLLPRSALVITTTRLRAKHYRRFYRLARRPLVFQNRPLLAPPRQRSGPQGGRIREALGLGESQPVALYQGGLQPGRGLRNIVAAAASEPRVQFVFLGDGVQRASLEAHAQGLGVLGVNVHFLPGVALEALPEWTASADIGLQLLRNTCFNHWSTDSNKLFEYAQAGLAVLASDFPEIRRITLEHDLGVLVDPEDPERIAAGLAVMLDEPGRLVRHRTAALASRESLCWERVAPCYVRALEGVLQRRAV